MKLDRVPEFRLEKSAEPLICSFLTQDAERFRQKPRASSVEFEVP